MLAGLMRSPESAEGLTLIADWLQQGKHVALVAWYLQFADPFEEGLLRRVLDEAIRLGDRDAVCNSLLGAARQFELHPGSLIAEIFLPALRFLRMTNDFRWIQMRWFPWLQSPIIRALEQDQAEVVLDALVPYPNFEHEVEYIAAAIAERWPESVIKFIGNRLVFSRTDAKPPSYDAVPYEVHQLKAPFSAVPEILLAGARVWFDSDTQSFSYGGGRLLASVFPDLSNGLEAGLRSLVENGGETDLAFVLDVLSTFEGKACIYGLIRSIVCTLEPNSPLLTAAGYALGQSGMVRGAFGFAELYTERKEQLEPWLVDSDDTVRSFAAEQIRELNRLIAAESRSAEASIAHRKLDYGEELHNDKHDDEKEG